MARSATKKASDRIRALLLEYVGTAGNQTFNYRQAAAAIGENAPVRQRQVSEILSLMAAAGELIELTPGKYKAPQRGNITTGTFVRRANGKNSVITDDDQQSIFVAERKSMHALNGDRVRVNVAAARTGVEPEAEVIEILESKPQTFIGTMQVDKHFGYLLTDSKYLATDIFIPKNKLKGATTGDKVVVRITDWPEDAKNPKGEILDILGRTGENNAEIHAILAEFGLPYKYPDEVNAAAETITDGITDEEVARREDLRGVPTFTIDPKDAKDFDDALSVRRLANGNLEVGVHIADVTHYVTPNSLLDKEARERATSVYLVDRVVPMLPERLSNGICSLRPDEDKLTFSCIFEMDDEAHVINHRIVRTVTRSIRRFAYEEAQQVIETGEGDMKEEILTLDRLAKILRKERYDNGSVDFDRVEVRFDLDDRGHPTGVFFKESKDANKLIEEFMLLANRTVAEAIGRPGGRRKPKPMVYRVHDQPDPGKLSDLSALARNFGYKIKSSGERTTVNRSLNKMLADVKGKGEENFLSTLAIRSMAKAVYTTENIGHYGLGFDFYTHFTSPIRRYPDMMVHRLLDRYLGGGKAVNALKLEDQCKHSSEMEQLAANAERASIKYKQVEYLNDHLGEQFDGVISGVTEWGLYVELNDNKCEGLVPMRDMADDFYDFDEKNYCITGRRNGVRYRLGDSIRVRVARANLERKQLDFVIVDPRLQRAGEDDLGHTVTAGQALAGHQPKGHGRTKTRTRTKNGQQPKGRRSRKK